MVFLEKKVAPLEDLQKRSLPHYFFQPASSIQKTPLNNKTTIPSSVCREEFTRCTTNQPAYRGFLDPERETARIITRIQPQHTTLQLHTGTHIGRPPSNEIDLIVCYAISGAPFKSQKSNLSNTTASSTQLAKGTPSPLIALQLQKWHVF